MIIVYVYIHNIMYIHCKTVNNPKYMYVDAT